MLLLKVLAIVNVVAAVPQAVSSSQTNVQKVQSTTTTAKPVVTTAQQSDARRIQSTTTTAKPAVTTAQQSNARNGQTTTSNNKNPWAPVSQCIAGSVTINGRKCTKLCGIDRPGGDYGLKRTDSFQGCVEACAADLECITAQYREYALRMEVTSNLL